MERGICPRKEDTQMGITSSNKVVDRSEIGCDGVFQVTLALTAAPDIIENPTDIVLVLDRSGSMAGVPLAALKEGADSFIDIIQQATDDGSGSGNLGSGTRMGVVSFSSTAVADTSLRWARTGRRSPEASRCSPSRPTPSRGAGTCG